MCLRLGFRLSVWYYRLVTKDYDFPVPMFVLPEHGEKSLSHQEVLTLKQQLERQAQEKVQSQAELEAQQRLVALNGYIAILEGKQQETKPRPKRVWRAGSTACSKRCRTGEANRTGT